MLFPPCIDCCCEWVLSLTKTIQRSSSLLRFCALLVFFSSETREILIATLASLCFRAWLVSTTPEVQDEPRDEADDFHLRQALLTIRYLVRDSVYPTMMHRVPENPPSHCPSSWSRKLDHSIPTKDFRAFLRLMVVLNF